VQAHTLGEMDILGIVLLRVYSRTLLPIFIKIGLYLTDKEQKISWHSFFETRCSFRKYEGFADIHGGSSWRRRQMTVGLLTTAIFGDLDGFRNVRDNASNII